MDAGGSKQQACNHFHYLHLTDHNQQNSMTPFSQHTAPRKKEWEVIVLTPETG
jgi:hypothetical protein